MKQKVERILKSRVKKSKRYKIYMENLIQWKEKSKVEATWVEEENFKKLGIDMTLISPHVP